MLAAGRGSRLGELTDKIPKPMVPIAGRPLLGWILLWLHAYGVSDVMINVCHHAQAIIEYVGDGREFGVGVHYSKETELLGTAGGVKNVEDHFPGDFLVVYGDLFTGFDLGRLVEHHEASGAAVTMAVTRVDDVTRAGIVETDKTGRITRFEEKPDEGSVKTNLANAGIYALTPRIFDYVEAGAFTDFGRDVFPAMLGRGEQIDAWEVKGYLQDIGSPERLDRARRDALDGRVPDVVLRPETEGDSEC